MGLTFTAASKCGFLFSVVDFAKLVEYVFVFAVASILANHPPKETCISWCIASSTAKTNTYSTNVCTLQLSSRFGEKQLTMQASELRMTKKKKRKKPEES